MVINEGVLIVWTMFQYDWCDVGGWVGLNTKEHQEIIFNEDKEYKPQMGRKNELPTVKNDPGRVTYQSGHKN